MELLDKLNRFCMGSAFPLTLRNSKKTVESETDYQTIFVIHIIQLMGSAIIHVFIQNTTESPALTNFLFLRLFGNWLGKSLKRAKDAHFARFQRHLSYPDICIMDTACVYIIQTHSGTIHFFYDYGLDFEWNELDHINNKTVFDFSIWCHTDSYVATKAMSHRFR